LRRETEASPRSPFCPTTSSRWPGSREPPNDDLRSQILDADGPVTPAYALLSGILDATGIVLAPEGQTLILTTRYLLSGSEILAQRFDDPCRAGNVNAGLGRVRPQIRINGSAGGSDRTVTVPAGEPISVELREAPATPAGDYVVYVWLGPPTSSCDAVLADPLLSPGHTLNPTPFRPGLSPQPFFCIPGAGTPAAACQGTTVRPGPPTTPLLHVHPGLSAPRSLTFQALQEDDGALDPSVRMSVTNGITLIVE
jgi:hypothetical protein